MIDKKTLNNIIYSLISLSLLAFFVIFVLPVALIIALGFLIAAAIFIFILRLKLKNKGIKVDVTYSDNANKNSYQEAQIMKDVTNSNRDESKN